MNLHGLCSGARSRGSGALLLLCAGLAVSSATFAGAQDMAPALNPFTDGLAPLAPTQADFVAQSVTSISKQLGVTVPADLGLVMLPAVDRDALLAEDELAAGVKVPVRIGVARDVVVTEGDGRWLTLPGKTNADGMLWVATVRCEGARAVRLHLSEMNLPEGARIAVLDASDQTMVGEYNGRGIFENGEMFAAPIEGDTVRIEYYAPPGATGLPFDIDSLQHYYRDVREAVGGYGEREGNCHNDVTCYPAWANAAKAVGHITFVNGGTYICTGSLLATTANDYTPLFLTANHCISTNAVANTTVVYWLYQTSVCNSGSFTNNLTSSGCTLVSTNATGDFTLMMVEGTVPRTQVFWLGWDSNTVANGTQLACIHHPAGAYKRISFGTAQASTADHIRCNWTSAVTEGGSSGSPLMVVSTQRVIGDLTGGPSACGASAANLYDTYGYMSYNFTNASGASGNLAAGSDDALEQNDSCAAAVNVASTSNSGLIVKWNDEDWYRFTVPAGANLSITSSHVHNNGNIDFQLFGTCGGAVLAQSIGTTGSESISYTNASGASATYYLRAYLTSDVRNTYSLNYSIGGGGGVANDACASATTFVPGTTYTGSTASATNDGATSCGSANTAKDVWYSFTPASSGTLTLNTCGSGYDTVLSVHSGCPGTSANSVACNDDIAAGGACTGNMSGVSAAVTAGTTYRIRVSGYNGASGNFTLAGTFTGTVVDNNACANATAMVSGTTYTGTTATATNDGQTSCGTSNTSKDRWYKFTAPSGGSVTVDTCGSAFDSVLSIHSACGGTSANTLNCNDDASAGSCSGSRQSYITRNVTSGTTYYIRVAGYNGASGAFSVKLNFVSARMAFDSCGSALPVGDGTVTFSNAGAGTDGPDEPGACSFAGYTHNESDVWFSYVAACQSPITATTCGSNFDTKITVYETCPTGSGTALVCNDDAPQSCDGSLQSMVTFNANAGSTYLIRVGGFEGAIGDGVLTVTSECETSNCPADFNNDGGVDGEDVTSFFAAWTLSEAASDVNFDGGIDGADVDTFFIVWSNGGC